MRAFDSLNINVTSSDVEAWFQGDGPGYEHLNGQGIIELVTAAGDDNQQSDEEDEDGDSNEVHQVPVVSNAEAMECLDKVLT